MNVPQYICPLNSRHRVSAVWAWAYPILFPQSCQVALEPTSPFTLDFLYTLHQDTPFLQESVTHFYPLPGPTIW